ncbi:Lrp/AsnC family transcriptional regulator [Paraburkholderia azotifigens]|uniref:Lrp/AsnC family transcriptional regulator n=1 Tax=Paraburkholderia azotifigens TaxID=2057004 RepID=UPI00317CB8D8
MQASQTQIDAFNSLSTKEISDTQKRIVETFGGDLRLTFTREEIAARVSLKVATVCGRVNELVKAGVLAGRGDTKRPGHRNKEQLIGLPVEVAA